MQLTKEQQKIVSDNHNLIYWYINEHNLDHNEYYDLLAIELCYAVMKHDDSRGSLGNYFTLRANGRISKEIRKNKAQKREHIQVSLVDNLHTLVDDDDIADMMQINELLDGEYGNIIQLKSEGYSQSQIAELLGTNQSRISKILKRLKREYYGRQEDGTDR